MRIVTEENITETEDERPFEVGETVELRSSGVCENCQYPEKEIRVMLNGREILSADKIRHSRKKLPKTAPVTIPAPISSIEIPETISMECNLIMRADEAKELLDYLDSAK